MTFLQMICAAVISGLAISVISLLLMTHLDKRQRKFLEREDR